VTVDEVLGSAAKNDLSSDADCGIFFESDRRFLGISVIENDGYAGLGNASLTALVDQVL
jgi:hypothetical protein